jgi:hypothetical protein
VGDDEIGLLDLSLPVDEDVDVDRSGAPPLVTHTPESILDGPARFEQLPRLKARIDFYDGVQKLRLRRASFGFRLVHAARPEDFDAGPFVQEPNRLFQVGQAITEVRT